MQPQPSRRDYARKLMEQLNNVKRAAEDYDQGDVEAALIIATALRTLFHRGRQTPLIAHLGNPPIKLLSTSPERASVTHEPGGLLTKIELDPAGLRMEFKPMLGEGAVRRTVLVNEWWESDYVYKDNKDEATITRKELALAVADKDGGAHVDAKLNDVYQIIVDGALWGMSVEPPNGSSIIVVPINAHLAPLRQMAWELWHSPALITLARKSK